MPDLRNQLRQYVEGTIERINAEDVTLAVAGRAQEHRLARRPAPVFAMVAIAFLIVIGGTAWLVRGDGSSPAGPTTTVPITPAPVAGFTCPPGSTPDQPGPADQSRPKSYAYAAATFDPKSGRMLALAQTPADVYAFWTFDVCTNTWTKGPSPEDMVPAAPRLVYDVDSDRAIIFARGEQLAQVWVHEPDARTWTMNGERAIDPQRMLFRAHQFQAVYDPVTGLVLVREPVMSSMWSYDVDTDTWTEVDQGTILPPAAESGGLDVELLTYDASADRLILYAAVASGSPGSIPPSTWEYDIRAGRWEEQETNTLGRLNFGWWQTGYEFVYDQANEVSVLHTGGTWVTYDASRHLWTSRPDSASTGEEFVTYDPVNERILVAGCHYGWQGICEAEGYVTGFDVATEEWISLLEPTTVPDATATTSATTDHAFDFATDSLCDWFTAAEMNQIIAAAQERAGTTWGFTYFEAGDCIPQDPYDSAAPWEWSPWLWATSRTGNPAPGLGLSVSLVPFAWVLPESLSYGGPAEVFVGHEMLDDSVTYGDLRYVSSWAEDMSVDLRVEGHEDEVLRFTLSHSNPGPAAAAEAYDAQVALGFAVADAMLRDMGWID